MAASFFSLVFHVSFFNLTTVSKNTHVTGFLGSFQTPNPHIPPNNFLQFLTLISKNPFRTPQPSFRRVLGRLCGSYHSLYNSSPHLSVTCFKLIYHDHVLLEIFCFEQEWTNPNILAFNAYISKVFEWCLIAGSKTLSQTQMVSNTQN